MVQLVENPPAMWGTRVRSLGWEDPLEEGTATHSRILAWRIPRTVEPSGQRVGHGGVTSTPSPAPEGRGGCAPWPLLGPPRPLGHRYSTAPGGIQFAHLHI